MVFENGGIIIKKLIILVSVMCIGILLIGCAKQKDLNVPVEKNLQQNNNMLNSNIKNPQEFIKLMAQSGYKVNTVKQDGKGVLSGKLTCLDIDGASIYEYKNNQEMEQDAKTISADGSMIGYTMIEWVNIPHFYKSGNIIVCYIGDNKEVLKKIEKVMGQQFAGQK